MLLQLFIFLLPIAYGVDQHEWVPAVKQCLNLDYGYTKSAEECRDGCGADDSCEIYQYYPKRRGGDCFTGKYDPVHCWGFFPPVEGGLKSCDVVRAECCRYIYDYELVPHQTWGRTPRNLRGEWRFQNCDEVVGGAEMTECPYDCEVEDSVGDASGDESGDRGHRFTGFHDSGDNSEDSYWHTVWYSGDRKSAVAAAVHGDSSAPLVVNAFALVGLAFVLYGAGSHFLGKQKSAEAAEHTEL